MLKGILTTWDTTDYFSKRAEDMMLVERIEKAMRDHIEWAFTDERTCKLNTDGLDAMSKTVTGGQKSFDQLTYGEYLRILIHEDTWNGVGETFDLDRDGVANLLEQVRDIRNTLAHFREEITKTQRKLLRKALQWLEGHSVTYQKSDDQSPLERPFATTIIATTSEVTLQVEAEFENSDSAYAKLAAYLFQLSVNTQSIKLSFEEIEGIIGRELPDSAYKHRAWWANDSVAHSWSKLWLDAEWRAQSINLNEKHVTFSRIVERQRLYIEFFSALMKAIQENNKFSTPKDIRGGESYTRLIAYLHSATKYEVNFSFSFARSNRFRVELYLYAPDASDKSLFDKRPFDRLFTDKEAIESELGMLLTWERLEDTRATRIAVYHDGSITDGAESLAALRQWAVDTMLVFEKVLHPRVKVVLDSLKQ